ncbi:MAG: DNA-directed RNA polymerase subunit K [Thaumarchaeota archaeon]|nr:DNA-directed RNA polymerase subunit K [Candidatus Calditenuaceae archaeon]MDW8186795.1 DNA-directed RNA polymerase subunit K [Nitrososphaerota archaeon]
MVLTLKRRLTKYEETRIIGGRALQLSMGAFPLVKPNQNDTSFTLAMREFKAAVLPIVIRRRYPDGTYEDVPLQDLLRPG